jgi:ankyrin repeat protein
VSVELNEIFEAIKNGNVVRLNELVQANPSLVNTNYDARGDTPLHTAACEGMPELVAVLLSNGADVHARQLYTKDTPLHIAAHYGHEIIVSDLLTAGADVNATIINEDTIFYNQFGFEGETPLHKAVAWGYESVVNILLAKGADVNIANKLGRTPLHLAVTNCEDELQIVTILLRNGAIVNAKNNFGGTPLHSAAYNNHQKLVALLLATKLADISILNKDGHSARDVAIDRGYTEVARIIDQHWLEIEKQKRAMLEAAKVLLSVNFQLKDCLPNIFQQACPLLNAKQIGQALKFALLSKRLIAE